MSAARVQILVELVTNMPDDELEADAHADNLTDEVERAVDALAMVYGGSATVCDFVTVDE